MTALATETRLRVYTGSIKSSAARRDDALNVTRGTGHGWALSFAPSSRLFLWIQEEISHRRLGVAWPEYCRRFFNEMALSQAAHPEAWKRLLAQSSVTLLCYCENVLRCHRYLLGSIVLPSLGATYEGEFT